ncbi:hypothetical protein BC828DRAFT_372889 [Blastocladiella britannica]|nr:hypothetical protein BC828DRAFT_372889 [Blastocladiella britannica]
MTNTHRQLQLEEMEALSAIFPASFTLCNDTNEDEIRGQLAIEVPLGSPLDIACMTTGEIASINCLPDLVVSFCLPPTYPIDAAAKCTLSPCPWLSCTSAAQAELEVCINTAVALAASDAAVALYDVYTAASDYITQHLSVAAETPWELPADVYALLVAYDRAKLDEQLASRPFSCQICLEERPARLGVVLPSCKHIYCRSCLQDYFMSIIASRSPTQVRCPHQDCRPVPPRPPADDAKEVATESGDGERDPATRAIAAHPVPEWFLADLLGVDMAAAWAATFREHVYAADPRIVPCPIPRCTGVAVLNRTRRGPERKQRGVLGTCLDCAFTFCALCLHAWHGPVQPCSQLLYYNAVQLYKDAVKTQDPHARQKIFDQLAVKYSLVFLADCVRLEHEERLVREWLKMHGTTCPGCGHGITRIDGCPNVECTACHSWFRCSALDPGH